MDVVLLRYQNNLFSCGKCLGAGVGVKQKARHSTVDEGGFWTVKCVFIASFISNT